MPWFFSIEQFPEVQALPTVERRKLLKESHAPGVVRLIFAAGWRALLLSLAISGILHAILVSNDLQQFDLYVTPPLFLILLLGTMAAFHYWIMMRYRGRLRTSIREASRGNRTPICLACGHDLTGVKSEQCPECGTRAEVPHAR